MDQQSLLQRIAISLQMHFIIKFSQSMGTVNPSGDPDCIHWEVQCGWDVTTLVPATEFSVYMNSWVTFG